MGKGWARRRLRKGGGIGNVSQLRILKGYL